MKFKLIKSSDDYFELDLAKLGRSYITDYLSNEELFANDQKLLNILKIDPEAEVDIQSYEGILKWTIDWKLNRHGIEGFSVSFEPATITVKGVVDYFPSKEAEQEGDVKTVDFSIDLHLKNITAKDVEFYYDTLYPDSLEIHDAENADVLFS